MMIYNYKVTTIAGDELSLQEYQNKAMLIVNTASQCGFTPQLAGLESLYQELSGQGLIVLGFPCNQFGKQDPKSNDEIAKFCETKYQVTFPLFAKIEVNGRQAHPLFQYLKSQARGVLGSSAIKWNFTKFLVDQKGNVVKRYGPNERPELIKKDILVLL